MSAEKTPLLLVTLQLQLAAYFLRYLIKDQLPHLHNMKDSTSSLTNVFHKASYDSVLRVEDSEKTFRLKKKINTRSPFNLLGWADILSTNVPQESET